MPDKNLSNASDASRELRARAEKHLRQKNLSTGSSALRTSSSPEEMQRLIHELTVHQIELEMQQEELAQSRIELEASLDRYTELYDFAPLGYLTIDQSSKILAANLTATNMLGVARSQLLGIPLKLFFVPEDYVVVDAFIDKLLRERVPGYCIVSFVTDTSDLCQGPNLLAGHTLRIDASKVETEFTFNIILSDITEQKVAEEKITGYVKQLEATMQTTLQAVAKVVEAHDPYTAGHERRVGIIASDIAREMGWSEDKYNTLELVGLVHDIGKMSIPAEILTKPGKLSAIEFELVKTHAENGYQILKDVEFPLPIARIIREHHERMDGSGYPQGLKGENTLLESRILAVADVLESMASNRPYRPSKGLEEAIHEIESHRAQQFDPEVVDAMLRLFHEKGYQLPV